MNEAKKAMDREQDGLANLSWAKLKSDTQRTRTIHQCSSFAKEQSYRIGYYFVCRTVLELAKERVSIPEALDAIITNPPNKVSELRDSREYIRRAL